MAECEFQFSLTEPVESVLARARQALTEKGGSFEEDGHQGSYSLTTPLGDFRGTFEATSETLSFVVIEKPFLVPCKTIERTLREKLFPDDE